LLEAHSKGFNSVGGSHDVDEDEVIVRIVTVERKQQLGECDTQGLLVNGRSGKWELVIRKIGNQELGTNKNVGIESHSFRITHSAHLH
jgi:hypothetical protein